MIRTFLGSLVLSPFYPKYNQICLEMHHTGYYACVLGLKVLILKREQLHILTLMKSCAAKAELLTKVLMVSQIVNNTLGDRAEIITESWRLVLIWLFFFDARSEL